MQDRLTGKVIIVAGAGGIGDELARRFASEGASVVLGDIDGERAQAAAEAIVLAGGSCFGIELDGSNDDAIAAAVALAEERYGGLDGFHANFAGFNAGDEADLLDLEMAAWDEVMRINSRGFVICTKHAVPAMLRRGGGSIVYTSSDAAYMGEVVRLGYAMSKASIHALMRHTARRFGKEGIRANVIAPGVIAHDRLKAMMPAQIVREFEASTIVGHLGEAADIAAMAALLMSDEGRYITGQVINVNGGVVMRP
jgi:NAD(P)-dependent dehydrogenase (short-subunit alcohol dehydrogenase family)